MPSSFYDQQKFAIAGPQPTPKELADAKAKFEAYATANNYNVGNWEVKSSPNRISVRYLKRNVTNPPGFIKGTVSPPTADSNALQQKAIAEFREEIGIQLDPGDLLATSKPNVFVVNLKKKVGSRLNVLKVWNSLGVFTELVKIKWVPASSLAPGQLNPQSDSVRSEIPTQLPMPGGRRKTLRSKSKGQKVRSKQWSSVKSSRSRLRR